MYTLYNVCNSTNLTSKLYRTQQEQKLPYLIMTTTVIKTQERTRKRLRTNTSEIVFKELYQEKTTNDEQEDAAIVPPTEISFDKKHQSILLITHFKDPLKVQSRYPIPELQPYEILVNNKAIGLNPIDWKGKKYGFGIYHFPG